MQNFLLLLAGHFTGDLLLQAALPNRKKEHLAFLALHAITYTLCITAALLYLGIFTYWKFAAVLVSHFVIDYVKSYLIKVKGDRQTLLVNVIDQLLHLAVLLGASLK